MKQTSWQLYFSRKDIPCRVIIFFLEWQCELKKEKPDKKELHLPGLSLIGMISRSVTILLKTFVYRIRNFSTAFLPADSTEMR